MEDIIRILQLPGTITRKDGRMSVVMNAYKSIDRSKFQFDFMAVEAPGDTYADEIRQMGGKIFLVEKDDASISKLRESLKSVIKKYHYKNVHYHAISEWGFTLGMLKKMKIPNIIVHSHATKLSESLWKRPRNRIFSLNVLWGVNQYIAASKEAGKTLFWPRKNYKVIPNAVDIGKFKYNNSNRYEIRDKYQINNDTILIGHIGRFAKQKNHKYLLNIFKVLHSEKQNTKLLLIGSGPDKNEIIKDINNFELQNDVIIINSTKSPEKFYSAMDIFLMPSYFEGLPMAGVEAQANGLPIIFSDTITKEANIVHAEYIGIKSKNIKDWVNKIKEINLNNHVCNVEKYFKKNGFDAKTNSKLWEDLYY
ncbi:glycosyltransferase [Dellaglioa sp. L3N]